MGTYRSPFDLTKAVDLTDAEVLATWVDLPEPGFRALVEPTSAMPLRLVGGKGTGRTHLMRYYSVTTRQATGDDLLEQVRRSGYLGVYLRCTGLNSGRFAGRGQPEDLWRSVFAYHFDLWMAWQLLTTLGMLADTPSGADMPQQAIVSDAAALFDDPPDLQGATRLEDLRRAVDGLRREVDLAVNNANSRSHLEVSIRATRGRLVFGLPQVVARLYEPLSQIRFMYLIDELENLTHEQQRYVNTLVREKELPASFILGSRRFGLAPANTYSGEQENQEEAEHRTILLDEHFREAGAPYEEFCRRLVARRISTGRAGMGGLRLDADGGELDALFQADHEGSDPLGDQRTAFVLERDQKKPRPYFQKLQNALTSSLSSDVPGVSKARDVAEVLRAVQWRDHPLVEKAATFLLYRAWSDMQDLRETASRLREQGDRFIEARGTLRDKENDFADIWDHWHRQLLAQLLRECRQRQRYLGFRNLAKMSGGLPRSLLTTLRYITEEATFAGERPFEKPISVRAQGNGIRKASQWYLDTAVYASSFHRSPTDGVTRLADFLREFRYADKPSEVDCVAFAVDVRECQEATRELLDMAVQWCLLLDLDGGHKDKNAVRRKYQLHPMLAPRWDLPIGRRGVVSLRGTEVDALFLGESDAVLRSRLMRLNAPFVRGTEASVQESLSLEADR